MKKYIAVSLLFSACALQGMEKEKVQGINAGWGCLDDEVAARSAQNAEQDDEGSYRLYSIRSGVSEDEISHNFSNTSDAGDSEGSTSWASAPLATQLRLQEMIESMTKRLDAIDLRLDAQQQKMDSLERAVKTVAIHIITKEGTSPFANKVREQFKPIITEDDEWVDEENI